MNIQTAGQSTDRNTPVTVLLLGPFTAKLLVKDLPTLPKKAQALLAFLLLNRGRPVPRDDLATLLWSNTATPQALQSLRQSLSVLRRTLPPYAATSLEATPESLTLADGGAITSDIEVFHNLAQSHACEDLTRAEGLHRGELLAGLRISSGPFEDWLRIEREQFLSLRLRVLEQLAMAQARAQDFPAAISTAKRLTSLDPFREESSRLLMRLLAASGQRGLALVEHAKTERLLREELGLSSDIATRVLAEKIRRGQLPPVTVVESVETNATPIAIAAPKLALGWVDRPTVGILPFANLTGDAGENHVVDGVTEDVTFALARDKCLDVVICADAATFRPSNSALASLDPSLRYLASGSLRRDGKRVRLMIRLTDSKGHLLWSGRVEDDVDLRFVPQDRLAAQVAARFSQAIRTLETEKAERKPPHDLTAYELYLRATACCRNGRHGNTRALAFLQQALVLDPELGAAYALAARCYHVQRMMGWRAPDDPQLFEGIRLAHRALELDSAEPETLWMSALAMANLDGSLEESRRLVDQSLAINPNCVNALVASCFILSHLGDCDAAIERFLLAQQLNSLDTSQHLPWHAGATAYFIAGRYEEADFATDNALAQIPSYPGALRMKVATAGLLGKVGEARQAARSLCTVNPGASIAGMRAYWKALIPHVPDAVAAIETGWRSVGMPEQ